MIRFLTIQQPNFNLVLFMFVFVQLLFGVCVWLCDLVTRSMKTMRLFIVPKSNYLSSRYPSEKNFLSKNWVLFKSVAFIFLELTVCSYSNFSLCSFSSLSGASTFLQHAPKTKLKMMYHGRK